ncbi:tandem-95 repeat protein, partial [Puteibacter caeruleilacunae]
GDGPSTSSIVIVTNASHGVATVNDNGTSNDPTDDTISYVPNADYHGNDSFIYRICDANGDCDEATVFVNIESENDDPIANADVISVDEDTTISGDLTANDTESTDGGNIWSLKTAPQHGSVTVNVDGTYTYIPNENYNGPDSFAYRLCDTDDDCSSAIVDITVNPVNDPPVISDVPKTGIEDQNVTFEETDFSDKFIDIEGDALTKVKIETLPENGMLQLNGVTVNKGDEINAIELGNLVFIPNANWFGETTFTWNGYDGNDYAYNSAQVNITINPDNDAPIAGVASMPIQQNPGGDLEIVVWANKFSGTDIDGTISKIKINQMPTNVDAIIVDGVRYTAIPAGGIEVTTTAGGQPLFDVAIDPENDVDDVVVSYKVVDNEGLESVNTGTVTIPFTDIAVAGTIYHDVNGLDDNQVNGNGTNVSDQLYINLVDESNNVVSSKLIASNGDYEFTQVDGLEENSHFKLIITNREQIKGVTLSAATYPDGWTSTGEQIGPDPGSDGTIDGILEITTTDARITSANFGINGAMTVSAGDDATICSTHGGYVLKGVATNFTAAKWTTTGTGSFDDPTRLDAEYLPSDADIEDGQIQLTLTVTGVGVEEVLSDMMVLTIRPEGTVDAGLDASICMGESYQILDAFATEYESFVWTHDGNGNLENTNSLAPVYQPEINETGVVTITLTVKGKGLCPELADQMEISIADKPALTIPGNQFNFEISAGICGYVVPDEQLDAHATGCNNKVRVSHNFGAWGNPNSLKGAVFPVGITEVIWTATDEGGNETSATITIEVVDNETPEFVNCPSGTIFTIGLMPDNCKAGAIWSIPVAKDNCSEVNVAQTKGPAQGSLLESGDYEIEYTATDAAGNTAVCGFTIKVIDTENPIIVCPGNMMQATDNGRATWTSPAKSLSPALAGQNCPAELTWVVKNPNNSVNSGNDDVSGYEFAMGTSTVTYTYKEIESGQKSECTFLVTVSDEQVPDMDCPEEISVEASTLTCEATFAPVVPTATDNSGEDVVITYVVYNPDNTMSEVQHPGDVYNFAVGVNRIEWIAEDPYGNQFTCIQFVIVTYDVQGLDAYAGDDSSICSNSTFVSTTATAKDYTSLSWSTSGGGSFDNSSKLNPIYTPSTSDILDRVVTLTLTVSSGCASVESSMQLTIDPMVEANAGPDVTACFGEDVQIDMASANHYESILWTTSGDGELVDENTMQPTYIPEEGEKGMVVMNLTARGVDACGDQEVTSTMYIHYHEPLIVTTTAIDTIYGGTEAMLWADVEGGSGNYVYSWSPAPLVPNNNAKVASTVELTETTIFELTVTDVETDCQTTIQKQIYVEESADNLLNIKNGISPNGDGVNDTWKLKGIDKFPENEVIIFNRWGDEIKRFNNYNNEDVAWDGTNKHGAKVVDGTYYYVLIIPDVKKYSGWIQVMTSRK